jgi:hypothetical protein
MSGLHGAQPHPQEMRRFRIGRSLALSPNPLSRAGRGQLSFVTKVPEEGARYVEP